MASSSTSQLLSDRQIDVETPEHVAIGYELADLGSRFAALLIDGALVALALTGLYTGIYLIADGLGALAAVRGILVGAMVLIAFAVLWGYFVLFEGLRDGQTPGKRRIGIRVVHDGGFPLTVRGAAIRNLVRLVDIQPAPSWMLGGLCMMLHPQTKRLGDLAAGTIVVRDRAGAVLPEETPAGPAVADGPPRLTDAQFDALELYVQRRASLAPEVRAELSRRVLAGLAGPLGDDVGPLDRSPDTILVAAHEREASRRRAAGSGGRVGSAQATALVRRQRAGWDEYAALLEDARGRGLNRLDEVRVSRFAALYREVAADLARARTYGGSPELLYTLERLVGSGHNLLYRPPSRSLARFGTFVRGGFAVLVRRRWKPIALAALLLFGPGVLSYVAVRADPVLGRDLIGPVMTARAEDAATKQARGEGYVEVPEVSMPIFASQLISNNVQVTFLAFAGGMTGGVLTVVVLVINGVLLGGTFGAFGNHGQLLHIGTFVAPHGVIELAAICIAGGAGLWLGSALLLPGRRTRAEVLVRRGRESIALIGGTAMMLVCAGIIEGFISPSQLPGPVKFAFAAVFALAMAAYFVTAGRDAASAAAADEAAGG
jgi:uncharacterized membrane protein SpoIIM required for sporulation/uncharacterized RDD family membrane protein YckC